MNETSRSTNPLARELGRIDIDALTLDPKLQFRALKRHVVVKYADAIRRGEQFPPILVVLDREGRYYLADGQHRVAARREIPGFDFVEAEVVRGEFSDALWLSCGANQGHGLPRTQEAKRRAILAALRDPILNTHGDREIGRHIGCDHKTVGWMRKLLRPGEFPTPPAAANAKKRLLLACRVLSKTQPKQVEMFEPNEKEELRAAYESLGRLLDRAEAELVKPAEGEG